MSRVRVLLPGFYFCIWKKNLPLFLSDGGRPCNVFLNRQSCTFSCLCIFKHFMMLMFELINVMWLIAWQYPLLAPSVCGPQMVWECVCVWNELEGWTMWAYPHISSFHTVPVLSVHMHTCILKSFFFHLRAHNQCVDYSGAYNWGCLLLYWLKKIKKIRNRGQGGYCR